MDLDLPDGTVAVMAFLAGQASALGLEWFRARQTAKHTAKARSSDFQRDTLLAVQDALAAYIERQQRYLFDYRMNLIDRWRHEQAHGGADSPERREIYRAEPSWSTEGIPKLRRLMARVESAELRAAIDATIAKPIEWARIARPGELETFDEQNSYLATLYEDVGELHGRTTEKIGSYLRRPHY